MKRWLEPNFLEFRVHCSKLRRMWKNNFIDALLSADFCTICYGTLHVLKPAPENSGHRDNFGCWHLMAETLRKILVHRDVLKLLWRQIEFLLGNINVTLLTMNNNRLHCSSYVVSFLSIFYSMIYLFTLPHPTTKV